MAGLVDAHVHLQLAGLRLADAPHDLDHYLQSTTSLEVDRFAALAMAPAGDVPATRAMNDELLALVDRDPRAFALPSVHPADGQAALDEVDRVAGLGASGLKLHPNTQGFDVGDDGVLAVVRRAGERGLPVLFDSIAVADPGQPEKFLLLAVRCPDARIVLAHALGPKFVQAVNFTILKQLPGARRNVYLELSALAPLFAGSPFTEQIAWVCRNHGLDRVLWGSDYPMFDPGTSHEAVQGFGFDDDELDQVCARTARELYCL